MKRYALLILAAAAAACNSSEEFVSARVSQPADRIVEYTPAPGQFINEPQSGFTDVTTPEAACAYAEQRIAQGAYVSLGGWGGTLVARFDEPVPAGNDYELWVRGNTFDGSSEPGIVYVMQDTNGDGLPNDTWYELKGSEYDRSDTGYEITYLRPEQPGTDIAWRDNRGGEGVVARNGHHTQESYFPAWVGSDALTFSGTLLPSNITESGDGLYVMVSFGWGYADNASSRDLIGGVNCLRIANAVTADGEPANLTQVDFIKVQTGVNDARPLIGEISTEVCGIGCFRTVTRKE